MGRIRTVKPEFFTHAGIFDAEAETGLPLRVAYIGLWTECDREGRFEWRPRELGVRVLPYDDCDFQRVLDALATRGFLVRYEAQGKVYGFIPSWRRHQVVNNKERQSEIPEPPKNAIENSQKHYASITRDPRDENASATRDARVLRGRERKGKEGKEIRSAAAESPPPRAGANGTSSMEDAFAQEGRDLRVWFIAERDRLFPNSPDLPASYNDLEVQFRTRLRQGLPPAKIQETIERQMARAANKGSRPPHNLLAYEKALDNAVATHHASQTDEGAPSEADIAAARRRQAEKDAKLRRVSDLRQAHSAAQGRLRAAVKADAPEAERQEIVAECDRIAVELEQAEAVDA